MNNLRSGGVQILIHEEQIWLILVCGVISQICSFIKKYRYDKVLIINRGINFTPRVLYYRLIQTQYADIS